MDRLQHQKMINCAQSLEQITGMVECKTMICFGQMLSMIRDKKFDLDQDVDIGVVGDPTQLLDVLGQMMTPGPKIVNDATGIPLHATFTDSTGMTIDVFHWIKSGGIYYHTYDVEDTKQERPPRYLFKGVPEKAFDVPQEKVDTLRRNPKIGRLMSKYGTWNRLVPGLETEGITLPIPFMYGLCLDIWYPDWATRRPMFGVSHTPYEKSVKSCKNM